MSDPINLQDLLDKTDSDFPDLPSLPEKRTFFGKLTGEISAGHSKNNQTPFFHFGIRLESPGKDVTPSEIAALGASGYSLSDYNCGVDYYLTPNAMVMFRRFCQSIGLDPNKSYREKLKLDETGNPTQETVDLLRGIEVMCRTPEKGTNGRVYAANMDQVGGIDKAS